MHELRADAHRLLLRNLRRGGLPGESGEYVYVCPSPAIYHHQWLWDSCFHAIVMARFDGDIAQAELRTLVSQIRPDGFLPHLTNWTRRAKEALPDRIARWLFRHGHHGKLTQPPVLGIALEEVFRHTGDIAFVRECLPAVQRYYIHLAATRDPDADGLLSIVFPIESGMDHSPMYDQALGLRAPGAVAYHYANLQLLVHSLRLGWDTSRILAADRFSVEDVGFNCLYAAGLRAVARLLLIIGDSEASFFFSSRAAVVEQAIISRCYSPDDGLFYSLYCSNEIKLRAKTVASLLPLILESLPSEMAAGLATHLRLPGFATPFPVPSVACDEPAFSPAAHPLSVYEGIVGRVRRQWARFQLVWRGPTWVNTNWMIARGLRLQGYADLADELTLKTATMVERAGFWEYYHPITGKGLGAEDFGWSTLVVDMLDEMGGQAAPIGAVHSTEPVALSCP